MNNPVGVNGANNGHRPSIVPVGDTRKAGQVIASQPGAGAQGIMTKTRLDQLLSERWSPERDFCVGILYEISRSPEGKLSREELMLKLPSNSRQKDFENAMNALDFLKTNGFVISRREGGRWVYELPKDVLTEAREKLHGDRLNDPYYLKHSETQRTLH